MLEWRKNVLRGTGAADDDGVPAAPLAREQFVYCPDVVDQGVQTVGNLAALLRGGRNGYFWWD